MGEFERNESKRTQSLPHAEGFLLLYFLTMTAFTIASDPSNHPKPPSRENFKAFLVNGGVESDFAFPVSWNERSITV